MGGGRFAQGLAAWRHAFAAFPLAFGHQATTSAVDVLLWVAIGLALVRALLRPASGWWVAVGALVGAATLNKLLVALLVGSVLVGLAVAGPRRLPWRWVGAGAALAVLLALPTLLYQVSHGLPQLTMASELGSQQGPGDRRLVVPGLVLLLGPALVPMWVAAVVVPWRRPGWRPLRCLGVALVALVTACTATAAQLHYPLGLLAVLAAVGSVPVAQWAQESTRRRGLVVKAVIVNSVVGALVALPVVPVSLVGATPLPVVNVTLRDSVGWPRYVSQVAEVVATLTPDERRTAAGVASDYGEAGALDRFGPPLGVPRVVSGHNELWSLARPPASAPTVVTVGAQALTAARRNATCTVVARLDDGVGVENAEQGQPVAVCRGAARPWSQVWESFRHVG